MIVCPIILLFFFLSSLFIFSILSLKERSKVLSDVVDFKFLRYDSLNKEISRGFVTIPNEIERNDYSFNTEDILGIYTLISEFGSEEYHCEGSCWCEDSERRSRSSVSLRRPIFVLVSALTLSLGISKANEYFEEKCILESSSSCPNSLVHSEVHSCEKIFDEDVSHYVGSTVQDEVYEKIEKKKFDPMDPTASEDPLLEEWVCEGFCMNNGVVHDPNGLKLQSELNCQKLRMKKEYSVDGNKIKEQGKQVSRVVGDKFLGSELREFCRENSVRTYETVTGYQKTTNLCVGTQTSPPRGNIKCRRRVSKVRRFLCKGHCVSSGHLKTDQTRRMAEDFGCDALKLEEEIEITVEEMKERKMKDISLSFNLLARRRFVGMFLKVYCARESRTRYLYETPSGEIIGWRTISLCRSRTKKQHSASEVYNLSVRCLQTFPRRESYECKIMGW